MTDEMFIKIRRSEYYRKKIADSLDIPQWKCFRKSMTKLCFVETKFTVGYSGTITRENNIDWHGYQKHDRSFNSVEIKDTVVFPTFHAKLFSVTRSQQKCFQVISEGK